MHRSDKVIIKVFITDSMPDGLLSLFADIHVFLMTPQPFYEHSKNINDIWHTSFSRQFYGKWYVNEVYQSINSCINLNYEEKVGSTDEVKISQRRQLAGVNNVRTNYAGTAKVKGAVQSEMTIKWPVSGELGLYYVVNTARKQIYIIIIKYISSSLFII